MSGCKAERSQCRPALQISDIIQVIQRMSLINTPLPSVEHGKLKGEQVFDSLAASTRKADTFTVTSMRDVRLAVLHALDWTSVAEVCISSAAYLLSSLLTTVTVSRRTLLSQEQWIPLQAASSLQASCQLSCRGAGH